jgi:hypothetical protein
MMLIYLTFGMLVFLHDSEMVSISLEDNLTGFFNVHNSSIITGKEAVIRSRYRGKKAPFLYEEWDRIFASTFSVNQIGHLIALGSSSYGHLLGCVSFVRVAFLS